MKMAWVLALPLALAACDVTVVTSACDNLVLDGNETDIDCGGSCAACGDGRHCLQNQDCQSGTCGSDNTCVTPPSLPDSTGATVAVIDSGAALVVNPGAQAGYSITGNTGGTYRIVWTGDAGSTGTFTHFVGTVWTAGTFDSFSTGCGGTCDLEANDTVSQPVAVTGGERIDFDATATTGLDGFDFSATQEPVYFLLYVDGQLRNDLVFYASGGQTASPSTDPFGLQTQ
jgi:hypothetical protein